MKTILIFSSFYEPAIGGAEIAVKEIAGRLAADYHFILLTHRFRKDLPATTEIGGVTVHRLGYGTVLDRMFLFPILAFFKALKITRAKQVDLFWAVMVSYAGVGAYLAKLFRRRIPLLLTLQEGDTEVHLKRGKFGLVGFWWKLLLKKADYLQAISTYLADFALALGYDKKIAIVPNGVDVQNFSKIPLASELEKHRRFFNFSSDDIVVVTTSRLVEKNGVDLSIEAMSELPPKYKLLILGNGVQRQVLVRQTRTLALENRVIFAGFISHPELPIYLHLAKVFVRPSRSEGLGNAFLEAMAAKLPVVGTKVGGIPDFLSPERTGLFCEIEDPSDLAKQIKRLVENKSLAESIKLAAFELVKTNYSWEAVAADMKTVFEETSA